MARGKSPSSAAASPATGLKRRAASGAGDELAAPRAAPRTSSSAVTDSSSVPSHAPGSLPISARSVDYWIVVWYAVFWFTVMWTDLHNFIASVSGQDVQKDLYPHVMQRNGTVGPLPYTLSYLYFRWAETADPLLFQNPVWWQCIEWVNLLCLMPFALLAARAFYMGYNWIRTPAVVVSAFTFYSLILCIGTTLFHELPTSRTRMPVTFTLIYIPYLIFPALVVARVWNDQPFSKPIDDTLDKVIKVVASITYATFVGAGISWAFSCEIGADAKAACNAAAYTEEGPVSEQVKSAARIAWFLAYAAAIALVGNFVYNTEKKAAAARKGE